MEKSREELFEEKEVEMLIRKKHFLDESRIKIADDFDKYLLVIATSGLYLSTIFTDPTSHDLGRRALGLSWGLLIVSILLTLVSFNLNEAAQERQIRITEAEILAKIEGKTIIGMENGWKATLPYLKKMALFSFALGIVLLGYFYLRNFN